MIRSKASLPTTGYAAGLEHMKSCCVSGSRGRMCLARRAAGSVESLGARVAAYVFISREQRGDREALAHCDGFECSFFSPRRAVFERPCRPSFFAGWRVVKRRWLFAAPAPVGWAPHNLALQPTACGVG